jgi:hypothetical protein
MLRSFRLRSTDLSTCLLFCRDALSLSLLRGSAAGGLLCVGESGGCSELHLAGAAAAAASLPAPVPAALPYPFLTYGVSNLRTSARHAGRHGGQPLALAAEADASQEAHFLLPGSAGGVRLLHLFRRNPTVSLTLGLASPEQGAQLLCAVLGMRVLAGQEAALARPRAGRHSLVLAGPGQEPHNTTSLVLEQWEAGGASSSNSSSGCALAPEEQATLCVAVPDTRAALQQCLGLGLPTTPLSSAGSFVTELMDGSCSLHCVQAR